MRILIYCPLNPSRPGIHHLALASIFGQEWPEPCEVVFGRHDNAADKAADCQQKYAQAWRLAREGGYDALFTIEADMVVPRSALKRLLAVDASIAYGLYCMRHKSLKHEWLAYLRLTETSRESYSYHPALARDAWGKIVETAGAGWGCTLVRREVYERLEMRKNDRTLAVDCQAAGISQKHHFGVVCGHINKNEVVWPDIDGPDLYRIEKLDGDH